MNTLHRNKKRFNNKKTVRFRILKREVVNKKRLNFLIRNDKFISGGTSLGIFRKKYYFKYKLRRVPKSHIYINIYTKKSMLKGKLIVLNNIKYRVA